MRKLRFSVLILLIFALCFNFSVFAADASISLADVSAEPGDKVTVDFVLSDCRDIKTILLYDFICDNEDIEIESGKWLLTLPLISDDYDPQSNDAVCAYLNNKNCNGKIFRLYLNVTESAKAGKYGITCSAAANYKANNGVEDRIIIKVEGASVIVGDKSEDMKDDFKLTDEKISDDFIVKTDKNIIVSVFDEAVSDSGKTRVDELSDDEIVSAVKEIVEKSNEYMSSDLIAYLNIENKQETFGEIYRLSKTDQFVALSLSKKNAEAINDAVRNALDKAGAESVDELDTEGLGIFVNEAQAALKDAGIDMSILPASFDIRETAYAIEALHKSAKDKAENNVSLSIVAILACFVGVIVITVIFVIKRKINRG